MASSGYAGPATDYYNEASIGSSNYPTTTPQGFNVGYETGAQDPRNRDNTADARIAGIGITYAANPVVYRIDLLTSGAKNFGCAVGDVGSVWSFEYMELFDTSASLGVLVNGTVSATVRDATNTEYTKANWPGSQTLVAKTFSTTILRAKLGDGTNNAAWASIYVEDAAATTSLIAARRFPRSVLMH